MRPLTKEFVMMCMLKKVPIPLNTHRRRGALKVLLETGAVKEASLKLLGRPAGYDVLYPIIVDEHRTVAAGGWVTGDKAW